MFFGTWYAKIPSLPQMAVKVKQMGEINLMNIKNRNILDSYVEIQNPKELEEMRLINVKNQKM